MNIKLNNPTVQINVKDLAAELAKSDDKEQSIFFNELSRCLLLECGSNFKADMQTSGIVDNLDTNGKRLMLMINEFLKP
jgi:hypothetical protein